MKPLKNIPEFDRPREKMEKKGPAALSNLELLAVLLGSGIKGKDVLEVARDILKLTENGVEAITMEALRNIDGVGGAKASQVLASIEYARRLLTKSDVRVASITDILTLVGELRDKRQEYFLTLTLDGAGRLIQKRTVFIGTPAVRYYDPDTFEVIEDQLPEYIANVDALSGLDEFVFIRDCYPEGALKSGLNERERNRLLVILQTHSYHRFVDELGAAQAYTGAQTGQG
jgi:DNA repair protein RadC